MNAILYFYVITSLLITMYAISSVVKKDNNLIDDLTFKISVVLMIVSPLLFFAYTVPNTTVECKKDIVSKVSNNGNTWTVSVTYEIFSDERYSEHEDYYGNSNSNEYYVMCLKPLVINWPNGGKSYQNRDDEYGEVGERVTLISQRDDEFKIEIPNVEFEYIDQLKSIDIEGWLWFIVPFLSSIIVVFKYKHSQ